MKHRPALILLFAFLLVSCSNSSAPAQSGQPQKISQFDRAGLCDFMIDKSGVYHVVFQETPASGKPTFIYYSTSLNKGASWSKPITLSNDNTGNGAGYPRILQDASGKIYAIWKRYGYTPGHYTAQSVILDGPGGYTIGTIYYKVLSGGAWSEQVQLNETEAMQNSWFATVAPNGSVYVIWSQLSLQLSTVVGVFAWYDCDLLRAAALIGTTHSAYANLSTPSPILQTGYPSKRDGAINLSGYVDASNKPHLIYQDNDNNVAKIEYYDGKSPQRTLYTYPAFKEGNTFVNPAHLLVDEKGNDHLIFLPCPATLESEQVWDINLATNKTEVLTSIQKPGISIYAFQAAQGPNGDMSVTIEAGNVSGNNEAFGMFYNNGVWKNVGLSNNAAQSKFFSKDFVGVGGYLSNVSVLNTYSSAFASVAYDASGHKGLIMNIISKTLGNYGSTNNPFIVYMPVDR